MCHLTLGPARLFEIGQAGFGPGLADYEVVGPRNVFLTRCKKMIHFLPKQSTTACGRLFMLNVVKLRFTH